jgi:NAD-dependent SIR2 family protein deacetylase
MDLIRHLQTRAEDCASYSIFLGAGASVTSGIRSASELISEWTIELAQRYTPNQNSFTSIEEARKFLEQNHSSWYNQLNPYSSLFEKKYEFAAQRRRFVESEVDKKLPSIGYAFLVSLIKENFINTIFTTNFDDLVNEAFYQFSDIRPISCAHDSSINAISITAKRPKIVKIHGDYLFEDIKSTIRETESLEQNTKTKLMEFCKEYGLIVIGYSGNDRSVMDVLEFLTKQENYLKNGIYWCLRQTDQISVGLKNFLWKEKVYPVLIDGFDEFFAEAHKAIIKKPLDITSNKKDSRIQKVIESIVNDQFSLSKNPTIRNEIQKINQDTNKHDISEFLSEMSESSDEENPLSLSCMRNLLEIESLTEKGELREASDLCEMHYSKTNDDSEKVKYANKLINISRKQSDKQKALLWSDRLIEIDKYDVGFKILKSTCIEPDKDQLDYLKRIIKEHPYKFTTYNLAAETALDILENQPKTNFTSYKEVMDWLNNSINLDPSMDNPARRIKHGALIDKVRLTKNEEDKKNIRKEIEEMLDSCKRCNPESPLTLSISVNHAVWKNDYSYTKKLMEELLKLEKRSSKSAKKRILFLANKLATTYPDLDDNKGFKIELESFYEDFVKDQNIKNNPTLLLAKASYFIGQKRNIDKAISYFNMALECQNIQSNLASILNIAKIIENDSMKKAYDKIEENKGKISKSTHINLLSVYYEIMGQQEKALELINQAYNQGLSVEKFLTRATYSLLKTESYDKVLDICESYEDYIDHDHMEAVQINYQYAAKKLNSEKHDPIKLRNLSAQSKDINVKLCAFLVIGNRNDAKRIIKNQLERSYDYYYEYRDWPIIPQDLLDEVIKEGRSEAA